MHNKSVILATVLLTWVITSCTPEQIQVDQDRIYPSYELCYTLNENKTTASASFSLDSLNGVPYELKNPASIQYADETLIYSVTEGVYAKEFVNLKEGQFRYTNSDLNEFLTLAEMVDSIQIDSLPSTHPITSDLIISISTPALSEDEYLQFKFTDLQSGIAVSAYADNISSGNLIIDSDFLSTVGTGEVEVSTRRVFEDNELTGINAVGGKLKVFYELKDTIVFY